MATLKRLAIADPKEQRLELPKSLLRSFVQSPRIVIKDHPAGLWPVDPGILKKIDLAKLMADKKFNENYEIVIMPKAGM